jgi:hypothetical protein
MNRSDCWAEEVGVFFDFTYKADHDQVTSLIYESQELLAFLFDSLASEAPNMRVSVEEALSVLMPVMKYLPSNVTSQLENLLLKQIIREEPYTHLTAIRFTISSLPFQNFLARYICLCGLDSHQPLDVKQEAAKGTELLL